MPQDATCRRCSVNRVNSLCQLYEEAYVKNDPLAQKQIKALVDLAEHRGYKEGCQILIASLSEETVRKISWNVCSLLTDDDFKKNGVNTYGRRGSSS
ncbi:MAG: hypothetical protein HQK60_06550 [Deltaproteobacteria bacterium]|nr:hypothetical protein [Deltaproteobacteria bacterium]